MKQSLKIFFSVIVVLLVIPSGKIALGNHDLVTSCSTIFPTICSTGEYFWSKNSSDGHLNELICSTVDPSQCKIPYNISSNIVNIGMTFAQAQGEIDNAVFILNSASSDIGFTEMSSPPSDNLIRAVDFSGSTLGRQLAERDCPFGICDNHFTQFIIELDSSDRNWSVEEDCGFEYEPEKTIKHELFHALGFGHNLNDLDSLLTPNYACDPRGNNPVFHDIEEILEKYQGDWVISTNFVMNTNPHGDTIMTIPENIIIESGKSLTINPSLTLDIDFANYHIMIEDNSHLIVNNGGMIN